MMLNASLLEIQREIRAEVNNNTIKDSTRLLPASSLHLGAVHIPRSGVKELSGPTNGATEAACRPVSEGRNPAQ